MHSCRCSAPGAHRSRILERTVQPGAPSFHARQSRVRVSLELPWCFGVRRGQPLEHACVDRPRFAYLLLCDALRSRMPPVNAARPNQNRAALLACSVGTSVVHTTTVMGKPSLRFSNRPRAVGKLLWNVEELKPTIACTKEDTNVVPSLAHAAVVCGLVLFRIVFTHCPISTPTCFSTCRTRICSGEFRNWRVSSDQLQMPSKIAGIQ